MGALTATLRDRRYIWVIQGMRMAGLVALGASIIGIHPQPGLHGRGLTLTVTLAIATLGWIGLIVFDIRKLSLTGPLAVMAASGGLLGALQSGGPAAAVAAAGPVPPPPPPSAPHPAAVTPRPARS